MDKVLKMLLKDIKEKPGIHLGERTWENLYVYINGYRFFLENYRSAMLNDIFWTWFDNFSLLIVQSESSVFDKFFLCINSWLESIGELPIDLEPRMIVDWHLMDNHKDSKNSFRPFLTGVRRATEKYIARKSLRRVGLFINGYIMAAYLHRYVVISTAFWENFDCFVQEKYSYLNKDNAKEIILSVSPDEQSAFYMFLELLDVYVDTLEE